jgi:hypothetical protein
MRLWSRTRPPKPLFDAFNTILLLTVSPAAAAYADAPPSLLTLDKLDKFAVVEFVFGIVAAEPL